MTRPMLFAASLATSSMILLSAALAGAQIVVNSTGDGPNAWPLRTGICSANLDTSECTLRAAIQLANYDPSLTTITFDIPTSDPNYVPDRNPLIIIPLSSALPALSTSVDIEGPGPNVLELDGDGTSAIFAISGAPVTLAGLRIRNGTHGI